MTDKPHDALFRHAFSRVEHAAGALRAALPREVAACIDFGSLALEEGSFISQELAGQSCDLLFSAKRVADDGTLLIHVLYPETVVARVETGTAMDVPRWAVRVLTATTPDEVFEA